MEMSSTPTHVSAGGGQHEKTGLTCRLDLVPTSGQGLQKTILLQRRDLHMRKSGDMSSQPRRERKREREREWLVPLLAEP